MSSAFRRLVSERYHEINAKHLAPVTLETHLRVVITANNPNALRTAESHTAEDIGAIAKRVLYMKVSPRASEYLADLGGREYTRQWVQRADGSPGLVVEHFAHLARTLQVVPDGRFLVSGRTTQYHRELVTRGVPTGDVLVAVAASILGARGPAPDLVADPEDESVVWVNAAALHGKWRTLIDEDAPRPSLSAVGDALRAAATGSSARQAIPGGAGRRARYWPVSLAYVLEAAETAGLSDVDSILSRVRAMGAGGTVVAYNTSRHDHKGAP